MAKKCKTSTPICSRAPSPSPPEELELEEMGLFRCLRRHGEPSQEREKYSIFNSYNSLDASWHLDRANGENRSLDETDVRRALVDSRFHRDGRSAIGCCYNTSEIPTVMLSTDSDTSNKYPYVSRSELPNDKVVPISEIYAAYDRREKRKRERSRSKSNKKEARAEPNCSTSPDASWCLDRSDGTNRTLNTFETERLYPTAPSPSSLQLPINPAFNPFQTSPPPMPAAIPKLWTEETLTQGEIWEIQRREQAEAEVNYNIDI